MEIEQVKRAIEMAQTAAYEAAQTFFRDQMNSQDNYPCGFAWTKIVGVKGNTRLGRALLKEGHFRKSYSGGLEWWNPSGIPCQNVDVKEEGARAAAQVLERELGVKAYAGSRLD